MHSGELDCERKAIHLFADGCHLVHCIGSRWSYGLGTLAKECHSVFEWQRRKLQLLLGAQAQRRTARYEDKQAGTACQQISDERGAVQDLLDIVEHQQEMLVVQERTHLLGERGVSLFTDPEHLSNYTRNQRCITDGCQRNVHRAIGKVRSEVPGKLKRKSCLADTTGSCQGEQVGIAATQQGQGMGAFLRTPDKSGRRKGQTRWGSVQRSVNSDGHFWASSSLQ